MKKNMLVADRIARIAVAAIIIFISIRGVIAGATMIAIMGLAVIFALTGFIGFCPLYSLFRSFTQKKKMI
jgi:hypothetical protein